MEVNSRNTCDHLHPANCLLLPVPVQASNISLREKEAVDTFDAFNDPFESDISGGVSPQGDIRPSPALTA